MSILIKGMEMPVTCCHCPLMGYDPDREWFDSTRTGAYICVMTHELIDNTKREEHCPLVEIPPHGRLGDLDAFESIKYELPDGQKAFNRGFHSGVQYVQRLIMDAPTIIPAEEGE